jgi:hypothetical protein
MDTNGANIGLDLFVYDAARKRRTPTEYGNTWEAIPMKLTWYQVLYDWIRYGPMAIAQMIWERKQG